jgi:hypothetical protein
MVFDKLKLITITYDNRLRKIRSAIDKHQIGRLVEGKWVSRIKLN